MCFVLQCSRQDQAYSSCCIHMPLWKNMFSSCAACSVIIQFSHGTPLKPLEYKFSGALNKTDWSISLQFQSPSFISSILPGPATSNMPWQTYHDRAWSFKGIYTYRHSCSFTFIAALFTTVRTWKQCRFPSSDEWIITMWYLGTMKFYLVVKKKKIMRFAGKCKELENIILRKPRPRKKNLACFHTYVDFSFEYLDWCV